MKIKITKDEATNFINMCSAVGVNSLTIERKNDITYFLMDCGNSLRAQFNIGNPEGKDNFSLSLKSPEFFAAVLSNVLKSENVELNVTKNKIEFNGYKFSITNGNDDPEDGDEEEGHLGPIFSHNKNLVKIGVMKKQMFESNFKNDFVITYSNCFVKETMMGVLLSAKDGKIVKANPGSMLYQIGKIDADLASETFASHDSPIAHSRAACIFTENMFNIIDKMNFDRITMYIPRENSSKRIGFDIDDKMSIEFCDVYVPGIKALEHYTALIGENEVNSITLPKTVIKKLVDSYMTNEENSDTFINVHVNSKNISVVIDEEEQGNINDDEIKVSKNEMVTATIDLNTIKFLYERISGDSITLLLKKTDVFSEGSEEKRAYFNIHDGDNEYFFKAGNE